MAGYNWRFIFGLAGISVAFLAATLMKRTFKWDEENNEAFERLKKALTTKLELAFPDLESRVVVETHASSIALGAVLAQKTEDG